MLLARIKSLPCEAVRREWELEFACDLRRGYPRCEGVLGMVTHAGVAAEPSPPDRPVFNPWSVFLEEGYVQVAPGWWRLGRHAAARLRRGPADSRRPVPRRPMRSTLPDSHVRIEQGPEGQSVIVGARTGWRQPLRASLRDGRTPVLRMAIPLQWVGMECLETDDSVVIECPRCGCPSEVKISALWAAKAAQLERAKLGRARRKEAARAGTTAQKVYATQIP